MSSLMTMAATCLSCLVVLATASTWPTPSSAGLTSSPSESAPTPTRTPVDASEIGVLSPDALDEIAERATAEAAHHDIAPHELRISLVVIDHLEVIRGVRVSIVTPTLTLSDPKGDPRGPLVAECRACGEDELKTVSIEGVLEALSRFDELKVEAEAAARAEAEAAATTVEPEPRPVEPSPTPDPPARRPLRPLGWAGIATLALGTSAAIIGITFVGLGQRPPAHLRLARDQLRDYPTAGYALLGLGSAVAISGAVMLGVERRGARSSTLTLAPLASPTTAGLQLRRRF